MVIRAFSDFKAFLYISIGGFSKPPIKIYKKALKSEKARITYKVQKHNWGTLTRNISRQLVEVIVTTIKIHIIRMKSYELECCFMDFSLIKLNVLQSEGKIWVTDLHFHVFRNL